LYGVGSLVDAGASAAYGFVANDRLALPAGGERAADGAAWGRPAVRFGPPPGNETTPEAQQRAHQVIFSALGAAVPAWAGYRKVEADHAGD
jgi:hypothetical protein